jgi:polyhydroxyalkanoate synthesis regulator protein
VQSSQAWSEFMHKQVPVMQNLMQQYIDQSKNLYLNTQNLFGLFGNMPSADKPGRSGADGKRKSDDEE